MKYPLAYDTFTEAEKQAGIDVILSGKITMGEKTKQMEEALASYLGVKYCVMVNSGSSANLMAIAAAKSDYFPKERRLYDGDEVLVPAVAWATSVAPLMQLGLKPVFVDVDPNTLNMDLEKAKSRLSKRTRAVFAVHILGNSVDMDQLTNFISEHSLLLIEDTCESMGSMFNGKKLGTFGAMGTYSSYFSHHITTGEGGYVVTNSSQIHSLLLMLRSHGWARDLRPDLRDLYTKYSPDVDPRFMFMIPGFNLRPTDISAAFGIEQMKKIETMNKSRIFNRDLLVSVILAHAKYKGQLTFPTATRGTEVVWFGFPFFTDFGPEYKTYLTSNGVDNRPIVSGNFLRQPMLEDLDNLAPPTDFPGAERVHTSGLYIGLPPKKLARYEAQELADILLGFE